MKLADPPPQEASEVSRASMTAQFLRNASRSTGARQGVLALVDQGIASTTTFLTMLILARNCSQDEVGIYSLCLSLVLFASMIQGRALSVPYMVFSAERSGLASASLLGSTLVHQAVLAGLTVLVSLAYCGYLVSTEGFSTMTISMLALCAATVPYMIREFLRTVCFAHFRLRSAVAIDGLVFLLQIGSLGLLVWLERLTIPVTFLAIGIACALGAGYWFAGNREGRFHFDWSAIRSDAKLHWDYSRWLVYGRLLGDGCQVAMPWVVAALIDRSAAGVLAVCVTLAGFSWVFVRGLNNLLQPRAIRAFNDLGKKGLVQELFRSAAIYAVVLGTVCVVFALAGTWLLGTIFGPEFSWAKTVLVVLGVNTLVTSLALTSSNGLNALQLPEANFWGEAATFVAIAVAAVPLITAYGILGAAVAMLCGAMASFLVMTWVLVRRLRIVDTAE